MNDFERLMNDPVDRRVFLKRMSAAGLGTAALALFAGCGGSDNNNNNNVTIPSPYFPNIPGRSVNEAVLNYALTLETLEADLYRQALNLASQGKNINDPLPSDVTSYTRIAATGGLSSQQADAGYLYLKQFAQVEAAHRDFLRTAIQGNGGTPVSPNANGYKFAANPNLDIQSILQQILPLEETGVRAYLGAAPYLSDSTLATIAVGIYSTEARHSAAISYILGLDPGPAPRTGDKRVALSALDTAAPITYPSANTFEYYLSPADVLATAQAAYYR